MRERLKALSPAEREAQSAGACEKLCGLGEFQEAGLVLAYRAMAHECDPALAVEAARAQGKTVAFPLCGPGYSLRLLAPVKPDAFQRGRYGIWEPIVEKCREVSPAALDFIILPGLAFDRFCNRLGQGAGYYDRLLPNTKAFVAGLGMEAQLVPRVPTGPLDVPLHAVAVPGGLWRR